MSAAPTSARLAAAQLSKGISNSAIYQKVATLLEEDSSVSLLDFGCGQGNFLSFVQDRFPKIRLAGVDILPRPESFSGDIDWREQDLNLPTDFGDAVFDVVTAVEVIEHLENPRQVARQLFSLLKPGGRVVISTPNTQSIRSFSSLLLKGHFDQFTGRNYPAHITALLQMDFSRILTEAGFEPAGFHYTDTGLMPLPKTAIKWQSLGLPFKGFLFSDNVIVSALKPLR